MKKKSIMPPKTVIMGGASTNQPPVASNDSAVTNQDTAITIDVATNASDPDGSIMPSSVAIASDVSNGSTRNNNDGTVNYTPNAGFTGSDSFTYTVLKIMMVQLQIQRLYQSRLMRLSAAVILQ